MGDGVGGVVYVGDSSADGECVVSPLSVSEDVRKRGCRDATRSVRFITIMVMLVYYNYGHS